MLFRKMMLLKTNIDKKIRICLTNSSSIETFLFLSQFLPYFSKPISMNLHVCETKQTNI